MTLINRPNALPSVALVLYRYLSYSGGTVSERDLARAVAPASISTSSAVDADDEESAGTRAVDETLSLLKALGTIRMDKKGGLTLDPELPMAVQTDDDVSVLRLQLRRQILSDEQNGGEKLDLWASSGEMRDFTRAVSWFLVQDVWAPPGRFTADDRTRSAFHEQARQLPGVGTATKGTDGKQVPLFNTGIRWNAFQRWAVFLGLAAIDTAGGRDQMLVPDPTVAVRDVINAVAKPGATPVRKFVKQLTDELPVLDGGRMQEVVTQKMAPGTVAVSKERLSSALSHALMRLSDEGVLTLEPRSDSPDVMTLASPGGSGRVVSRVVLK